MEKFDLSKDEIEILNLYSKGNRISSISEKLNISSSNMDIIIKSILDKLKAPTLVIAVIIAIINDLLD